MARVKSFKWEVQRSFIEQNDDPITIGKKHHDAVRVLVGDIDHQSATMPLVTAHGLIVDAAIRHSVSGYGDYYQINSRDPESIDGLERGQVITIELWAEPREVRLLLD